MKFFFTITKEGECSLECLCVRSAVHHSVICACFKGRCHLLVSVNEDTAVHAHLNQCDTHINYCTTQRNVCGSLWGICIS